MSRRRKNKQKIWQVILEITIIICVLIGGYITSKIEKANNDIKKSIELSDKSQYYEDKARSAENNNAIYR